MALTVDGIFSLMPELFVPEKAAGVNATVVYRVTGEGGGDYSCIIRDGKFELKREAVSGANSEVQIASEDWIALNEGKLDPMQAFMTGKLKGTGDLMLLQKFPKFFRKPEAPKGPKKPLSEVLKARLALAPNAIRVTVGAESFGPEGAPALVGEESAVRGLVAGTMEPGPDLLAGRLSFQGDMAVLRGAWKAWSQDPEVDFPDTKGGKALATLAKRYKGGAEGTLELKVDGQAYALRFGPERLQVLPCEAPGQPSLTIGGDDFALLNEGKLNLAAALLEGRLAFRGDFSRAAQYTAHFEADVNPAKALLESMPERFNPEKAGDLEAVVGYELEDLAYTLIIRQGRAMVFPRLLQPCDTALRAKAEDFAAMSTGKLNAQEAFMTGKIRIEGDPLLMQKVAKSFRKPE